MQLVWGQIVASDMQLRVLLDLKDNALAPLNKIKNAAGALGKELKSLQSAQLGAKQFKNLANESQALSDKLGAAKQRLKDLTWQVVASASPNKSLINAFKATRNEVLSLQQAYTRHNEVLKASAAQFKASGISAKNFSQYERELGNRIETTIKKLEKQNAAMKRIDKAKAGIAKAGSLYATGAGAMHFATRIGDSFKEPIEASKHFQTEETRIAALGLGDKATADSIKYAKAMKTYGTSTQDNLTLVRDALTVFADEHHAEMVAPTLAKMKFANEAMFGEEKGADNERKFMDMLKVIEMRNGLTSAEEFKKQAEMVQKVITATGGRVGAEEWLNTIKTGGIAAKGIDSKSFYYQMEPIVQEMGGHRTGTAMMSAYQNLYQGRTTKRAMGNLMELGLIGDTSKVKHDKAGQISFMDPGAIKGADLFRSNQFEWMEKILLPSLTAKGITGDKAVLDAIGSIFSNRTAGNLFATMYQQRAQIHKNAALNEGADGIDQLYAKTKDTAEGKELDLLAKRADLYRTLGNTILPTYVSLLEKITVAAAGLTGWMEQHPLRTEVILKTVAVVSALAAVFGMAAFGAAAIIGPISMASLAITTLGTNGPIALGMLKNAIVAFGGALQSVGAFLMANPIILAIGLLIAAGYLLYKNWDGVVAGAKALWEDLGNVCKAVGNIISSAWDTMIEAISRKLEWIFGKYDAMKNMLGSGWNWVKEKTGLGGVVNAGKQITAGVAMGAAAAMPLAAAPVQFNGGGMLKAPAVAASQQASAPIAITVNPSAGMDEKLLAKEVQKQMSAAQQRDAAAKRSKLSDKD